MKYFGNLVLCYFYDVNCQLSFAVFFPRFVSLVAKCMSKWQIIHLLLIITNQSLKIFFAESLYFCRLLLSAEEFIFCLTRAVLHRFHCFFIFRILEVLLQTCLKLNYKKLPPIVIFSIEIVSFRLTSQFGETFDESDCMQVVGRPSSALRLQLTETLARTRLIGLGRGSSIKRGVASARGRFSAKRPRGSSMRRFASSSFGQKSSAQQTTQ